MFCEKRPTCDQGNYVMPGLIFNINGAVGSTPPQSMLPATALVRKLPFILWFSTSRHKERADDALFRFLAEWEGTTGNYINMALGAREKDMLKIGWTPRLSCCYTLDAIESGSGARCAEASPCCYCPGRRRCSRHQLLLHPSKTNKV